MDSKTDDIIKRRSKLSPAKQAILEKRLQGESEPDIQQIVIPRRTQKSPILLSAPQQRLWFLQQLEPQSSIYNEFACIQLKGVLNCAALEKSFNEIVKRHESLRTSFETLDNRPVQVIHPTLSVELQVVNLSNLPQALQEAEVEQLSAEIARKPFDLAFSPLLRVMLLQTSEQENLLLLVVHHIVCDGWSIQVLNQELAVLYEAFSAGKSSPLLELSIQYPDYSIWQHQWLQGEREKTQLSYWKQQLANAPTTLSLPIDRQRPPVQSFKGAARFFKLSSHLSDMVRSLSKQQGVTLFMTLLAAFQAQLYCYTSQQDICIGSPIANRNHTGIEGLIGFFVNTLVFRTDLSGNPSFLELLGRVREVCIGAYTHADLPFERLVGELHPERNLSHTPLFQVTFALQEDTKKDLVLPNLTLKWLQNHSETAKFDLTLYVVDSKPELWGWWEYNTDLFDAATIERMVGHFTNLLEGIVTQPENRLSELPLLTESERQTLLVDWNDTTTDFPQDKCIHQLFEAQVARTPDAVAIVFEDQQLSYRELNQRANQLAHYLQKQGVKPEVLVGICVERSLSMVIELLAILKAGGAYVPLDPAYPPERLAFIVQDAQVSVLLTQQHLIENLPQHQTRVVCLDTDWEIIAQESQQNPINDCTTDNLAYIIYTSGSTGQPKGVLVNHSNVVRLLAATESWYNFNQQDVWTLFHSIAFDFSVWELWGALLYGGKLVVVPYWLSRSPEDFYKLLLTQQVTVLNQTPSAFSQLIQVEESLGTAKRLNLRLVIFGGEALQLESLRPWFERHGDQFPRLVNMYGITETTVHVTYRPLTMVDLEVVSRSLIGRPISDLQVYLLDRYWQPVPIGVPGEMYIGGAGVVRGYLNRPELTPVKFIPNPFNNKPNARLYKSGDLARYLANGDIEYLGRIDYQVKVRGFRIELGEIEALISQYSGVRETVVVVHKDSTDSQRIVAYIVLQKEQTLIIPELRGFLEAKLPSYMVPATFVTLEALPLTSNGKVDRRALPVPDTARPELEEVFVAPCTKEEKILADLWAKVLGLKQVGIHDNFFSLGGDSIRSIQVQSLAREKGLSFSIQQMFQHQTIYQLLGALETAESQIIKTEETQPFSLISPEEKHRLPECVEDAYPLTILQRGMVFHSEYSPEGTTYHDVFTYYLQAPLEIQALQAAIQLLVNRHPVLRTSFHLTDFSEPLQLVHQNTDILLQVEDWYHLSTSEFEDALNAWLDEEKRRQFDWSIPPLLRFFVHCCTEETFYLTVSFHHAILDGWSVASMLSELFGQYFSLLNEKADFLELPPLSLFRDFVALERETIISEESQRYWTEKLQDRTITILPRWNFILLGAKAKQVSEQEVPISAEISKGLQQLAQSTRIPLKSVLLTAHLRVLSLLCGHSDVLTGVVTNGRLEHKDGDRTLGLFLNTVPFRLKRSGGTWVDLVQEVFKVEQEWLPHRRYPLAEIQKNLGGLPLFETAFNFTHFHVYQAVLEGKNVQFLGGKFYEETNFPLIADFNQDPSSFLVTLLLKYDASEFGLDQIKCITEYYARTLQAIVSNPQQRYELHELLSTKERRQLLVEWNNTQTNYPSNQCIHELFEFQVERTPDAVAVVFEEQQLTYRELNIRANQLAHYLRSLGVKPEVLVGICVERSLYMIMGLLAILKAGGAYIPLDPSYPKERLEFILEDTQAPVLLTQASLVEAMPQHKAQVVCLDTDWHLIAQQSQENFLCELTTDNLAYVIYTSGSTGRPKGVMIKHASTVAMLDWAKKTFAIEAMQGVLASTSICFDLSVFEVFVPLCCGGKVILIENGLYLPTLLAAKSVTLVNTVPSVISQLLRNNSIPTSVQTVNVAGEPLHNQLVQQLYQQDNIQQVFNLYGPSEDTTYSTSAWIYKGASNTPPIGRPIHNTQIYLLDKNLQPVPVGVPGMLYIGGAGLARGYLNKAGLTADKFIPNPYANLPGERLYKTGDKARYLPNGEIEYIGRIDNQVKIRGFRIELGEIEALISLHPVVREAVVVVRSDLADSQRIVAYVVLQKEQILVISELRNFLESKLPNYMIPATFVILEALPLTPNGKVDRKALPAPELTQLSSSNYVPPTTPIENLLAGIWAEILGLEKVGIHNNFFTLGGHSLIATRVISQIRQVFKIELPLRYLFEKPTIALLAKEIETTIKAGLGIETTKIEQIERTSKLPLSFAQQRLWFLAQLEPDSPFYNIPAAVRLQGELNIKVLQQTFNEILRRHEALRTNFQTVEGQAITVISKAKPLILLPTIDISELPLAQQEVEIRQQAAQEAQQPFDISSDHLLRVKLLRLDAQEHIVLLTMHHIASDGWSIGVLVQELATLYPAFCNEQLSPLTELPIQYVDFAAWQRQWLQAEVLETQIFYWQKLLEDAPRVLELPTDYPRPAIQTFRGATYSFELSDELCVALNKFSQQQGSTLFMTLLAAFQTLLWRYTGQEDIVVGSPIANRNRAEIEGLIGFFVNTLVLRTNLAGNPSFEELIKRVREVALGAYTHQDLPFELLVEQLQPQRDLSRTPLFQVMFVLQNAPMSALDLPDLTLSPVESDSHSAKFDLTLFITETESGLVGNLEYSTDLFKESSIHRMVEHLQTLLSGIVINPQARLSELPLLKETEQHQLLVERNDTAVEYPQQQCIHQLFEAQVERTPDAVAAVFEDQQLTYRELNQRANKLAHYLRTLGVKPELLVGICVERSLYMIIGLLAILKAGGAYIPLDPSYPKERLEFILEDTQAPVLLTQASLVAALPQQNAQVVCLDTNWHLIAQQSQDNLFCQLTTDNLAYTIYTSGSTGKPKGVQIPHIALSNFLFAMQQSPGITKEDTLLAVTTYSFDIAALELFLPIIVGSRLVITSREVAWDATQLSAMLTDSQATVMQATPATWQLLLAAGWDSNYQLKILCGGEALPGHLANQLRQQCHSLWNMYGPTETTIWSAASLVETLNNTVPISHPIANTQLYILDQYHQLVPIGIPGELYIGGEGLARGYFHRPDLTAEKFIPHPFSEQPSARLYKTGDLARYLPNGEIEYIGRIDNQVKIRGFRIETGEIEARLTQYPTIKEAVVVLREDMSGDKQLVAYVLSEQELTLKISELRSFLREKIPDYMIPAAFVSMKALPLTPNGKVDRQSLPIPDNLRPQLETTYIKPQNDLETSIAMVWQKTLKIEKVGINDNFFELGGHSLLMVQVHSQLREIFQKDLLILDLFRYPTISSLAEFINLANSKQSSNSYQTDVRTQQLQEGKTRMKQFLKVSKRVK
ncbi:amino acid adenylation domain-containing protein [uncultured Nostoc sp.]|uniref:non-ribosomal peptide synthetase n=1 Tax=uncultured Nostoc sp. TaxID=340711 RepID=UPI0035CAA4CF